MLIAVDLATASELFDDYAIAEKVAWSSMTSGYVRRGKIDETMQLLNAMPDKDQVAWNVMITGCLKYKEMDTVRMLFDRFTVKNVVTRNEMISEYVNCGCPKEALSIFKEMVLGVLETGRRCYLYILEKASVSVSIYVSTSIWNAVIDMYAMCISIDRAIDVFREMKGRDLSTWNTLIVGLALHHAEESIEISKEMQKLNVQPNEVTFIGVILACSHSGRVDARLQYFSLMNMYNVEPNIEHNGCMVGMLGQAGLLEEAFMFLESMKIEPNDIIWRTILGACKV